VRPRARAFALFACASALVPGLAPETLAAPLDARSGLRVDGVLDPATGAPAWTGLIGATALAPTALEAETLAKTALLAGPAAARRVLAAHGGIAFHADGRAEAIGLLSGLTRAVAA
jgi:hypothetical protein